MAGSCRTLSKVPLLKLLIRKVEQQLGTVTVIDIHIRNRSLWDLCPELDHSVFMDYSRYPLLNVVVFSWAIGLLGTPLHIAAKERSRAAVKFLVENEAFLPPDINDCIF
ncbi:hypothetical protein K1719_013242 [Acacia pycnantha]|nr:hypothetical protein K1719_013242 [Acacia pycnantha]